MNKWQYRAEMLAQAERQNERNAAALKQNWPVIVAMLAGVAGIVFVVLFFRSESTSTETSGHLWWKDTTTTRTEIGLGTRLLFMFIGLALLAVAALCVRMLLRRHQHLAAEKKYVAILTGGEVWRVQQIAHITNQDASAVYRDIQRMIDSGTITDYFIDYKSEQVVSRKHVPTTSVKTVVKCESCGAQTDVIVGVTRTCSDCGEPLAMGRS